MKPELEPINPNNVTITIGEHTLTIPEMFNVCFHLKKDHHFGQAYIDKYGLDHVPDFYEMIHWILIDGNFPELNTPKACDNINLFIKTVRQIKENLAIAQMKADAEKFGYICGVF